MNEISKFESYKKKLQGICDEHDLVFRLRTDKYPFTLTIKPAAGLDQQMSMLENVEEQGYTSPDAYATLIIKGKKTLEQVPAMLREQVREILTDLEVQA